MKTKPHNLTANPPTDPGRTDPPPMKPQATSPGDPASRPPTPKPKLLIVDDDEEIRTQMKWALAQDYEVLFAGDRPTALDLFRSARPMVVLLDLGLPPQSNSPEEGLAALSAILGIDPFTKVIIVTGQSEKQNALRAIGDGAYDLLNKPVEMDELRFLLRRCYHVASLEREHRDMERRLGDNGFEGMLGTSPQMQDVFTTVRKVATTDAPVLILGESGTGKEMAALAIHQRSHRRDGPFVAINCGAIPETLLESELFGHEKGAFTGAHTQRKGRFEMAAGGTLFLDEIGELPGALQVKLLRFLQEKAIERVGGRVSVEVDARVIAATNRELRREMEQGRFREDLFYRLAVVVVKMPALRERQGDIELLGRTFLRRFCVEIGKEPPELTVEAIHAMQYHEWPGNVRELENKIKRAVIMAEGNRISAVDLELRSASCTFAGRSLKEAREALEREMVHAALQRHNWKISAAAIELGVSRPTLYELMEKLGIHRSNAKTEDESLAGSYSN